MKICTLNKIAACGTDRLGAGYTLTEELAGANGVMVRSAAMHDMDLRWKSFGWNVWECDGHSVEQLYDCIEAAKATKNGKPNIVLAHTVKGKGVSFMEGTNKFHGKAITDDEYELAMIELKG